VQKGCELMAEELFIPKLGQTVEEVTLLEWKVKDGEQVEFGQEVAEVETDKAVFPLEANANGVIHLGPYKEGDVLPVLTVVAVIGASGDAFKAGGAPAAAETAEAVSAAAGAETAPKRVEAALTAAAPEDKKFISPRARRTAREKGVDATLVTPTGGGGVRVVERDVLAYVRQTPRATPVARRMAEAEGVDLRKVPGSGEGGFITKADVQGALRAAAPAVAQEASGIEQAERVPLKGVRAVIAERMAASARTTARVTMFMDVDVTNLVRLRQQLKEKVESEWGFAPGYNDLLVKVCAAALRRHPYMNVMLDGDTLVRLGQVNVGVAVDTERGLLVPVVRDADRKSLRQVGSELRELVERARAGRALPDDLSGGTFTITNLGMYDVEGFTPMINLPECAILGVGRIGSWPMYVGDELVRRERMVISLAFDHRLVDGAPAARFMQTIKALLEEPGMMIAYV